MRISSPPMPRLTRICWVGLCCICLVCAALAEAEDWHTVRVVIDGDTLILDSGTRVRLSSINTPELGRDGHPHQPLATQAKKSLESMVLHRRVRLQNDVELLDRYDRRLAYVFTESGEMVNQTLLEKGWANLSLHPPNLKHAETLLAAERTASAKGIGIWGQSQYGPRPIETMAQAPRGQWGRFNGKLQGVETLSKGIRLWFSADHYGWVPKRYAAEFGAVTNHLGRSLEVRGWPSSRGDKWFVLLRHPSQLVFKP